METMFGGDVRIQKVEEVMSLIKKMTLAEMKAVVKQATEYHDAIVLTLDPRWRK